MNLLSPLAILYTMLTLTSGGLLYLTLRGKVDASAGYFLIAQLLNAFGASTIYLINSGIQWEVQFIFAVQNFFLIGSETAIFFSINSILRRTSRKRYYISIFAIAVYCGLMELARNVYGITAPMYMMNGLTGILAFITFNLLRTTTQNELKEHSFLVRLKEFEFIIAIFWGIQVLATALGHPPIPRHPTTLTVWIYAFYISISIFRYICYIGFRITWLGSNRTTRNNLNQPFAMAIEEKEKLKDGLMASNRIIGISALASSLAHQLSQPLTAIALQAESSNRALKKSVNATPRLLNSLEDIQQQSSKLSSLVDNLRQLFNEKKSSFHSFGLVDASNEVLEIIEPSLSPKNIDLVKDFYANPIVYGDAIQIQQVLINLFNNAADAIQAKGNKGGKITLTIGVIGTNAYIQLQDSGIGLDLNLLPSIFDLHYTTKEDGLGVGLWLCKTIIKNHNGSISASNSPAEGALFEVQIPLATYSE